MEPKDLDDVTNLKPEHLRYCLKSLGRYIPGHIHESIPAEEAIPLVIDHISSVHGYEHENLPNIPESGLIFVSKPFVNREAACGFE